MIKKLFVLKGFLDKDSKIFQVLSKRELPLELCSSFNCFRARLKKLNIERV